MSFELAQKRLGLKTILSIHANDRVLSHNKFGATQAKNKQNNLIKQHAFKVNDVTEKYFTDGVDIHQEKRKVVIAPNYHGLVCPRPTGGNLW